MKSWNFWKRNVNMMYFIFERKIMGSFMNFVLNTFWHILIRSSISYEIICIFIEKKIQNRLYKSSNLRVKVFFLSSEEVKETEHRRNLFFLILKYTE